jgi:serine protease SohB
VIVILLIVAVMVCLLGLIAMAKSKDRHKGKLSIKNLNHKYADLTDLMQSEVLNKKQFKHYIKERKNAEKAKHKEDEHPSRVYVLHFNGDIKASAVCGLSEEITAILTTAKPGDEVVLCLESAGGVVHGYGLAAAQLLRLKANQIRLTVAIDKVAASGGYMMACVADTILAAPFAIIGSIGVVVQFPNFNRLLKDNNIDFEQHTAGKYKRTITLFGENTEEGREKLQHEIQDIHEMFKNLIKENRQQIDIEKVATGEYWLGQQAIQLNLVDKLQTSDDYLFSRSKEADMFELSYETKKPLLARMLGSANNALALLFSH